MNITKTIILLFFIITCTSCSTIEEAQRWENLAQEESDNGDHVIAGYYYKMAAIAYKESGNNIKAMELYGKAAAEYEQAAQGYKDKENHVTAGQYYSDAAKSYEKLGNNAKAKQMYLDAATEYEANGSSNYANEMRTKAVSLSQTEL